MIAWRRVTLLTTKMQRNGSLIISAARGAGDDVKYVADDDGEAKSAITVRGSFWRRLIHYFGRIIF